MPVKIKVAAHEATKFGEGKYGAHDPGRLGSSKALLKAAAGNPTRFLTQVLQSSITSDEDIVANVPFNNGFVQTCLEAYNNHRHLVIRPDDVWMAILTQFSFYVDKHSEDLRSYFVRHKGKKELTVTLDIRTEQLDFAELAKRMGDLIHENVVDKDLQSWVLGNYTTTTPVDTACYSIILMATTKAYFDFKFCLMCGLPSVTLLGEQSDWELIRRRINKLKTFDATANPQLHQWHALLVPIIDNFILTFSEPDSPTVKEFWSKIAHRYAGGSGPSYLSGWITAFCLFSSTGEWQGEDRKSCWGVHDEEEWLAEQARKKGEPVPPQQPPLFDAKQFPLVDTSEIPPSWCEVQVTIDDRRKQPVAEYKAMMVAGLVGCSTFSSENPNLESESPKGNDTVQPYAGWWIFRKDEEAEERDEKDRQRY